MSGIANVKVYDMEESIRASKYPMSTDVEHCNCEITDKTEKVSNRDTLNTSVHPTAKREAKTELIIPIKRFLNTNLFFFPFLAVSSDRHMIPSVAKADNQSEMSNMECGEKSTMINTAIEREVKLSLVLANKNNE